VLEGDRAVVVVFDVGRVIVDRTRWGRRIGEGGEEDRGGWDRAGELGVGRFFAVRVLLLLSVVVVVVEVVAKVLLWSFLARNLLGGIFCLTEPLLLVRLVTDVRAFIVVASRTIPLIF